MLLIGLTGGIASGKSTVSTYLLHLGCPVIDADKIARDVVEPGLPAWKEIVAVFGEGILKPNREINREALRNIIFNDSGKRHLLNQCTHPHIQTAMLKQALWHFLRGKLRSLCPV
jgi:dephospho-CoA kinase